MKLKQIYGAIALIAGLAGQAIAEDSYTLKFSVPSGSKGPICAGSATDFKNRVEEQSGGRLKIEMYCDAKLSKIGDTFSRVESGIADIGWDLPFRYGKRFAAFSATTLPGLYTDPELAAGAVWKAYASGDVPVDTGNLKILWFNVNGNGAMFMTEPLENPTDLTGRKIIVGDSVRAAMVGAMGATAISLPITEFYQSLAKGVADGAYTSYPAVMSYALWEPTAYYLDGPFGGGINFYVMNKSVYDKLPADLQKVIDDNAGYDMSREASAKLEKSSRARFEKAALTVDGKQAVSLTPEQIASVQHSFDAAEAAWLQDHPDGKTYLDIVKRALAEEAKAQ